MQYVSTRRNSILGEVRNVEIPGPTQQLLCSKSHDFLAVFALLNLQAPDQAYTTRFQFGYKTKNEDNCMKIALRQKLFHGFYSSGLRTDFG